MKCSNHGETMRRKGREGSGDEAGGIDGGGDVQQSHNDAAKAVSHSSCVNYMLTELTAHVTIFIYVLVNEITSWRKRRTCDTKVHAFPTINLWGRGWLGGMTTLRPSFPVPTCLCGGGIFSSFSI